jgi:CNT family concentrative nucleoside transporter
MSCEPSVTTWDKARACVEALSPFSAELAQPTTPDTLWGVMSFERLFGYLFSPLAYMIGIPSQDVMAVGELLGAKIVLNEFVAYQQLTELAKAGALSSRSVVIASYALCGFANFGSIAIQIGGIGGIAPNRRGDLARLGMRAMIGGTLAALMTASVAGVLL